MASISLAEMYFMHYDQNLISKKIKSFTTIELYVRLNQLKCYQDIGITVMETTQYRKQYTFI